MYERAGVKEYWVIGRDKLHVYILYGDSFAEAVIKITKDLKQPIASLDGCIIDFRDIVERYSSF